MKILSIILSLACSLSVYGQQPLNQFSLSSDVQTISPPPEQSEYFKYRGVILGFGPRFLNTNSGEIITSYVDDSPSMDNFSSVFQVEDGYTQFGIQLGYKWGRYKGLSHDILFDFTASKSYTAFLGYSIGWNLAAKLGQNQLLVRPAAQLVLANTVFYLGQIENNAAYIQIGELQYFDRELDIELRAQSVTVALKLDLTYRIADRVDVFLKTAYEIPAGNSKAKLEFSPPSSSTDSPSSSSLDIAGTNPLVEYNGSKLESLPYETGGLRLTAGVSYLWNYKK